ncbi:holo-ACP synthase [bacterium]|nr:holo-ACP synthase [bacterium]MBU1920095.1 holo-ACP synthase [bacterium]
MPSLGIDMVEVDRISKHLHDDHFLNRIFTENERYECEGRAKPEECFAARWAAKEAMAKALGTGIGKYLNFKDVEVINIPGKGPCIRMHGHFAQFPMLTKLSLTHTRTTGAAVVMVFPGGEE